MVMGHGMEIAIKDLHAGEAGFKRTAANLDDVQVADGIQMHPVNTFSTQPPDQFRFSLNKEEENHGRGYYSTWTVDKNGTLEKITEDGNPDGKSGFHMLNINGSSFKETAFGGDQFRYTASQGTVKTADGFTVTCKDGKISRIETKDHMIFDMNEGKIANITYTLNGVEKQYKLK